MLLDMRDLKGDEPLRRVREILRKCGPEDEVLEVIVATELMAKRLKAFMQMSGCNVKLISDHGLWKVKMTGRNCYCS